MDRSTARGLVQSKVEDPDGTRFTLSQYNTALDVANQQLCIDGRAIVKEDKTIALVAGTAQYNLESDFLVAVLVRHNGLKLTPTTKYELSFQSGTDWTTLANGTPIAFYIDEQNGQIGLVPAPDGNAAAQTLTIDYIGIPASMTQDTGGGAAGNLLNNVTILQYYAMGVVAWAAREILTYIPQTSEITAKRQALFEDYQRYFNQLVETYKNMTDEPLQMSGGQNWADQNLRATTDAFSD
jgi:hypothetical protein